MRGTTPQRLRIVGLAGLLVATAAIYLVFAGRLPFGSGYRIEAVVASANQLKEGSPVRVAGVDVGSIVGLRAGPRDTAIVELELDEGGRPVHTDASVRIRPRLFLEGGFYVDLRPGSPSAPELADRGRIPLSRTALPVQFSQVLSTLTADVRRHFTSSLRELAAAVDHGGALAAGRATRPLGTIARDAAIVARAARGTRRGDTERIVRGTSRIAAALADRNRELGTLVTDLRRTAGALARREEEVAASVRGLDATLARAPAGLRAVDTLLAPAERFTTALRPTLRRAPAVLRDGDVALEQVAALVSPGELPRLLGAAGPAVRRLPTLARRVLALLPLVTPVTDCVRDRALPVLFGQLQDGRHSTGQPAWLELMHSIIGTASTLQTIDGNGYQGRVQASGGEQTLAGNIAPGVPPIVGRVSNGRIGSRPLPLGRGRRTPFRPDAECRRQRPVDLTARSGR